MGNRHVTRFSFIQDHKITNYWFLCHSYRTSTFINFSYFYCTYVQICSLSLLQCFMEKCASINIVGK